MTELSKKLLELLEKYRGEFVSGQQIATLMNVSRNAVWKTVKKLEEDGYKIESVRNRGYRLTSDNDPMSTQSVGKFLRHNVGLTVEREVTSTNDILKSLAVQNAPEFSVLVAEEQTAGKGRLGRKFYSPKQSGIYLSILLRPNISATQSLCITTTAAVAVCRALENTLKIKPKIKWVNDIFVDDRKVCGILTEASLSLESGGLDWAVLGIGLNVSTPEDGYPDELKEIASSVLSSSDVEIRSQLAAAIIDEFLDIYPNVTDKSVLEDYRKRSLLDGREVTVIRADEQERATVIGIDDDYSLIVKTENGERRIKTGEVSVRL